MGNGGGVVHPAGPTQIGSGDLRVPTLRAKIMRWLAPDRLSESNATGFKRDRSETASELKHRMRKGGSIHQGD